MGIPDDQNEAPRIEGAGRIAHATMLQNVVNAIPC